jgi:LCP family protein required for cell wall assembly
MDRSATEEFPPDFGLYDERPRPGRQALLSLGGLLFVAFLVGGFFAGLVFLDNFRVLTARRTIAPEVVQSPSFTVPGTSIQIRIPEPPLPPVFPPPTSVAEKPTVAAKPPGELPPNWEDPNRITVLLLGIDHRPDEPMDGSRSDTMMLVSVDPPTRSVVMVSLPRDLWVSIPGVGENRINVAHSMGGPDLAMRTVAANFGVRVQHYARIDFRGFEKIVDTMGGIQVDVERPIKDDEYPTEDYGAMRVYIAPGPQWMDGTTALVYARSRHSENDFGRARRQQRVLMAIRERAIQANMIFKAPQLVPLAQETINTSFGPADMIRLARLSMDIDRERISTVVVDTNYAWPHINPDGAEVLIPNRAGIQSAIQQAFTRAAAAPASTSTPAPAAPAEVPPTAAPTSEPTPPRVEVLNGTARNGLAAATAEWLRRKGFEVVSVGSADRTDYAESRLLMQPGREAMAAGLASVLGLPAAAVQPAPATPGAPDIRLILGQNYQIPTS